MELIKELREKTGAGIVECKKALVEAGNDIEKATEILRKKGIAKAAKRSERETSEGIVRLLVSDDAKKAYAVKLGSETDFVARNEKFQKFADDVLEIMKEKEPENLEALLALPMEGVSVKESIDTLSGVIGEKLEITEMSILKTSGTVAVYSHMEGRIGVLVSLDSEGKNELARDIAMQVAAANPKYLNSEEVPAEEVSKEKEIYKEQLLKEGKPENILDKILEGKIKKYYEEVCLLNQEFIKDDKKKIKDILEGANIEKFVRISL